MVAFLSLSIFGALEKPCGAECDVVLCGTEHLVVKKIHADRFGKSWFAATIKIELGFEVAICRAINDRGSKFVGPICGWLKFGWTEYWAWLIKVWFEWVRLGTLTKSGVVLGLPISVATSKRTPDRDTGRVSFSILEPCTWGWFAT